MAYFVIFFDPKGYGSVKSKQSVARSAGVKIMKKLIIGAALAALVLIVSAVAGRDTTVEVKSAPVAAPPVVPVTAPPKPESLGLYERFIARHPSNDVFFLEEHNDEAAVRAYEHKLFSLLDKYSNTTPRIHEIWKQTRYYLGVTLCNPSNPEETRGAVRTRVGKPGVVCLLRAADHQKMLRDKYEALFAYARGSGLVYAPALYEPDAIFAATFYHELGHMVLDLEGMNHVRPPRQPVGSAEYFEEEVEMTEIEATILNAATNGRYLSLVDQIIQRSGALKGAGKFSWLHRSVTDADLDQFEDMLGLRGAGQLVAKTFLMQMTLMLEFRYVDQAYSGPTGPMAQKVARYRKMRNR